MLRRFASLLLPALLVVPVTAQRAVRLDEAFVQTIDVDAVLRCFGTLGGVAADDQGNVFVANFGDSLWKVAPSGHATRLSDNFRVASGNTMTPDGRLLQSDFFQNWVFEVDQETGARTRVVRNGLNGPVGLAMDDNGVLYVCNCSGNNVRRVLPGSVTATAFAPSPLFNCPNGIGIGPNGDVFVVNFFDDNVLRIDSNGSVSLFATMGTSGAGSSHIAVVGSDLYVTKIGSHDLWRVSTLDGSTERIAGKDGVPGLIDGPARRARLRYPNGIAAVRGGRDLIVNNLLGPRGGVGTPAGEMLLRRITLR